jgi:glycosyltransferase involved in cell wall biosynthesis
MPWELDGFLDPAIVESGLAELRLEERLRHTMGPLQMPQQRVAALELSWYMRNQLLRDADWAGMAHSLEIRVPFVDPVLYRALAPMLAASSPPSKADLLDTVREALPRDLATRRKTGFSIPVHDWAERFRASRGVKRPLRNWAHVVYRPYKRLRTVAVLSDAFGGHGGIALYNRDMLSAVASIPRMDRIVAVPRLITREMQPIPAQIEYRREAANGKLRFLRTAANVFVRERTFDLALCCHINLLPVAYLLKLRFRCPLVLFIYGIDAWDRQSWLKRRLLRSVDRIVSISEVTRGKFMSWAPVPEHRVAILPNAIHLEWYGTGPKSADLVRRYRLNEKLVLMTLGRLISTERYKGFDEVLEVMPSLIEQFSNLVYLIVGDGSDRRRLEGKARDLGIAEHVRFAGLIPEHEKADHYRLADAFVMPSRGEGFGFVLLEAVACGIPTVASALDGGREALANGELGILVDPRALDDVKTGILQALRQSHRRPPVGLERFAVPNFDARLRSILGDVLASGTLYRGG